MVKKIVALTLPYGFEDETNICNVLMYKGLKQLHLRKPDFEEQDYEKFIGEIDPKFRDRIVIHNHFDLCNKYKLKGIHLSRKLYNNFNDFDKYSYITTSCHSFEDIQKLDQNISECFLSPIYNSISKKGYKKAFETDYLHNTMLKTDKKIVALGGINSENIYDCFDIGFSGAAVLGYLWGEEPIPTYSKVLQRWTSLNVPNIMCIAGFDPSSGAGVTADVKTSENIGAYAFGVSTAITFQNQYEIKNIKWIDLEDIKGQIDVVLSKNRITHYKIGLIESFEILDKICDFILTHNPKAKICWDPILKSSSGFEVHNNFDKFKSILSKIYVITPNIEEANVLFDKTDENFLVEISKTYNTNIIVKGGHSKVNAELSTDTLFDTSNIKRFSVVRSDEKKHGTGCLFSTALTALLAKGYSIDRATQMAQNYVFSKIDRTSGILAKNSSTTDLGKYFDSQQLMYITHYNSKITLATQIELVCRAGIGIVQLRMKNSDPKEFLQQAIIAKNICKRYNALLIINDNIEVCLQAMANGVHLGKDDTKIERAREILGDNFIIGATCNTFEDVENAYLQKADYVGIGPFRHTETKQNLSRIIGIEGYKNICNKMKINNINIRTYAIGGITQHDINPIFNTGINGIAMSSAILQSNDIETFIKNIYIYIE